MDDPIRNRRDTLPLAAERRIDRVCLEFENAWKSGEPPQIEQHLGTTPRPERDRLLRELLLLELDYRSRAGERPAAEEYHSRFPEETGLIEEVFQSSSGSSDDPASGTRVRYFGDYELLEKIARGGMGIVYRARQLSLNRVVALMLVLAGLFASEEEVERFHRESEAAANLQHPNIVAIYEVGQHDGQPYFSMAYVEGRSLAEIIREHPLPGAQAARYAGAVARAVEYAHQQGTLHRDLKPANILIDRNHQPQITDFGLAKRVDVDSDLTQSGQVLGSPSYMPPEQASAEHGEVGPASDVYALGAILYELLAGRPPFKAETATETLLQVLSNEPISPRELNLKVPRDLETICLKCLEKDPSRRYATAGALADDLDRFLRGEPIRARPSSKLGRAWRWCKRNPVVSSLVAGLAVVLLAGMVGVTWQWKTAEGARNVAEKEAERRRRLLYVSEMVMAEQAWKAGNVTGVEELLQRHRRRSDEEDLRGFHWFYLNQSCQRSKDASTLLHKDLVRNAAISPDGKTVAAAGYSTSVRLWDSKTKTLVRTP
jgi:serine/threonine protein kinase